MGEARTPEVEQRRFEARLAEYVSARDEMIGAISNQHLALTFGSAAIVGVLVAGFLTWNHSASWAVFLAVPPISAWVLAMWLAEVVRMLRSVAFCREQEAVINESLGAGEDEIPPLRWESWRDEWSWRTIRWSYVTVVAVLAGAYLAGAVLCMVTSGWSGAAIALVASAIGVGLTALLAAVVLVFARWTRPPQMVGMPQRDD